MIYGIKEYNDGSVQAIVKNAGGYILWAETFRGEPEMVQIHGSGQSVTILVSVPTCRCGRLITQVGEHDVKVENIAY